MHSTLPELWAEDDLSRYLDDSISNSVATFANLEADFESLKEIDRLFKLAGDSLNDVKDVWPATMFYRAHSSFRTSTYLVMAGHQVESYAVMRQCLEFALYAIHMARKPDAVQVWLERSENSQKCRNEFSYGKIIKSIKMKKLTEIARSLYLRYLDFGAHPNEASVFSTMKIERHEEGRVSVNQMYLSCESTAMDLSLKTLKQTGVCVLDIFTQIWKTRFQVVGIDELLRPIKSGL